MARPPKVDTNLLIAGLLRDLAAVQASPQRRWGYRRAAAAIQDLDEPIERLLRPDGTLRKIANIGPSSSRIILEILTTGTSPTVESVIASSGKAVEIGRRRGLRSGFLSRAEVNAALANDTLGGPSRADYRGDLQMHSIYSDGKQTLEDIVASGLSLGYEYCAVTDHSYGLPIARGVSMARLQAQHHAIDALNAANAGRFRLLKGIEANIRADGSVDMEPDELARLEIVVAAPHSALRSKDSQTSRMVRAVTSPQVHVLGHPRCRSTAHGPVSPPIGTRCSKPPRAPAWRSKSTAILRARTSTICWPRRALNAGCLFALDSDAHSTPELRYAETAVAHARLATSARSRDQLLAARSAARLGGAAIACAASHRSR